MMSGVHLGLSAKGNRTSADYHISRKSRSIIVREAVEEERSVLS